MKCPKCGYLGFETSDRCRNCGYEFSLSVHVDSPQELPLHNTSGAGAPLSDFDLADPRPAGAREAVNAFDLDRLIGADPTPLPLFQRPTETPDETPLINAPRPARPPLSVRRATPDVVRSRPRAARSARKAVEPELQLEPTVESSRSEPSVAITPSPVAAERAPTVARIAAACLDVIILATINVAVIYFTLAMTGLSIDQWSVLPLVPIATFFLLLDGGYLVAFTAANGQTIGKMAAGIRVMGHDGQRVEISTAVLRAGGCLLSLLTAGLGYLPAFFTTDGRALHDRIARTRVTPIP